MNLIHSDLLQNIENIMKKQILAYSYAYIGQYISKSVKFNLPMLRSVQKKL